MTELIGTACEAIGDDGPAPLVMADHEGDFVAELKNIIGVPPAPLAIAATGDVDLAHQVAYETGTAMRKLGRQHGAGPGGGLLPQSVQPPLPALRTFGRDPERGVRVRGPHHRRFPRGRLCSPAPSTSRVTGPRRRTRTRPCPRWACSREELDATDLVPFRRAIADGVDMMMIVACRIPHGAGRPGPGQFRPPHHADHVA